MFISDRLLNESISNVHIRSVKKTTNLIGLLLHQTPNPLFHFSQILALLTTHNIILSFFLFFNFIFSHLPKPSTTIIYEILDETLPKEINSSLNLNYQQQILSTIFWNFSYRQKNLLVKSIDKEIRITDVKICLKSIDKTYFFS